MARKGSCVLAAQLSHGIVVSDPYGEEPLAGMPLSLDHYVSKRRHKKTSFCTGKCTCGNLCRAASCCSDKQTQSCKRCEGCYSKSYCLRIGT